MKVTEILKGLQISQKDVDHFSMIFRGHIYFQTLSRVRTYKNWMKEVGLKNIQSYDLPRNHGVIAGAKT